MKTLHQLLSQPPMGEVGKEILALAKPSIRIHTQLAQTQTIGASRFGGRPDLPAGLAWPTYEMKFPADVFPKKRKWVYDGKDLPADWIISLPFIAQIRLSDIATFDKGAQLPKRGWLYFFHNEVYYGHDFASPRQSRVFYFNGDESSLLPAEPPRPVIKEAVYKTRKLDFYSQLSIPHVETTWIGEAEHPRGEKIVLPREQWYAYSDLCRTWRDGENEKDHCHRMLGYSDDTQPYQLENGLNNSHDVLFPDEAPWASVTEVEKHKQYRASQLLLQLESHDDMCFGRWGKLHFFIENDDLEKARFDRVWARAS